MWGIEGSFSGADITGQNSCAFDGDFNCKSSVNWLATTTAQVGWTVDHALLYIKGGAAWAGDEHAVSFAFAGESCVLDHLNCNSHETRLGALFGAGITYAIDPNWSAFLEYNYMDFGSASSTFTACGGGVCEPIETVKISQQIHVIKAGVNYKFDWWAPASASY